MRTSPPNQTVSAVHGLVEQDTVPSPGVAYRTGRPRQASARLLLVDDDSAVLESTAALLCDAGYDVVGASSGEDALTLLPTSNRFNFIVSDYAMPGITGLDLVASVRRLCPLIPAVIVTGFAGNLLGKQLPPAVLILRKPFNVEELLRCIEQSAAMMRGNAGRNLSAF